MNTLTKEALNIECLIDHIVLNMEDDGKMIDFFLFHQDIGVFQACRRWYGDQFSVHYAANVHVMYLRLLKKWFNVVFTLSQIQ